jgi:hypothetical protein
MCFSALRGERPTVLPLMGSRGGPNAKSCAQHVYSAFVGFAGCRVWHDREAGWISAKVTGGVILLCCPSCHSTRRIHTSML